MAGDQLLATRPVLFDQYSIPPGSDIRSRNGWTARPLKLKPESTLSPRSAVPSAEMLIGLWGFGVPHDGLH